METMQSIRERRSMRAFLDRPVEREHVERLLEAAAHAPIAGGADHTRFVVVDDREILTRIGRSHSRAEPAERAPLGIAVCADPTAERVEGFWAQDCAAATQNILLAAHDLRLGAVWIGVHPTKELVLRVRQLLELPSQVVPVSFVAVGYPSRRPAEREVSLAGRVHWNLWDGTPP
jgi:nitroreductase